MKESEKIKGIVFAYNTSGEYEMVKELGVEWMRLNICFPWADKMFGTLSEEYIQARQEILDTHAKGLQPLLLAGFPMMKKKGRPAGMSIFLSSWVRKGPMNSMRT